MFRVPAQLKLESPPDTLERRGGDWLSLAFRLQGDVASHYQLAYRFRYACPAGREFEIAQWFDGVGDASEAELLRDLGAVAQTLALQARGEVEFTPEQGGVGMLEALLARDTPSWAEFVLL